MELSFFYRFFQWVKGGGQNFFMLGPQLFLNFFSLLRRNFFLVTGFKMNFRAFAQPFSLPWLMPYSMLISYHFFLNLGPITLFPIHYFCEGNVPSLDADDQNFFPKPKGWALPVKNDNSLILSKNVLQLLSISAHNQILFT